MAKLSSDRLAKLEHKARELSAVAQDNRSLLQRIQALKAVNDFLRIIQKPAGVPQILSGALHAALSLSRSSAGSIQLLDREASRLTVVAAEGPQYKAMLGQAQAADAKSLVSNCVVASREPLLICGSSERSDLERRRTSRYSSESFISLPMQWDGELVGVLNVTNPVGREHYLASDLTALVELADQAGAAILAAREQQELKAFNAELRRQLEQALGKLDGVSGQLASLSSCGEAIVRNAPLGLLTYDAELVIGYANPHASRLLGYGQPDAKLSSLRALPVRSERKDWLEALRSVVQEGRAVQFYPCYLGRNELEEPVVLRLIGSPIRDARGVPVAGLLTVEDATEEAALEKDLMAAERQSTAGKLTAHVAHELNNPLDGILRFVKLALQCPAEDPRVREYLQEIRKGLDRMVGIVGDLLEFSRQQAFIKQTAEDCNELVREAVKSMSVRAAEQHVEIHLNLSPQLPRFRCGSLYQVFTNIIKNALDAMPGGGVLEVRSGAQRGELTVSFADSGLGMTPEVAARLFDPFFTTKPPGQGTGLGLAICRDIVGKYHGRIDVRTEPGQGSTFTVRLSLDQLRG